MADESVVRQYSAQVRMTFEQDAEQVESFAFEPVGAIPDVHNRRGNRRITRAEESPQAKPPVVPQRLQVVNDGKPPRIEFVGFIKYYGLSFHTAAEAGAGRVLGRPLVLAVGQVVDTAQVHQHLESEIRIAAQSCRNAMQIAGRDFIGQFTAM